ncbi:MAG: hypothetical protein AAGA60_14515 [Cyanobacteria bacterium P01_E01_bin.42]
MAFLAFISDRYKFAKLFPAIVNFYGDRVMQKSAIANLYRKQEFLKYRNSRSRPKSVGIDWPVLE